MNDPGEVIFLQTEHGQTRVLDTRPSPVEEHFDEAVKKAQQLEQPKKKTSWKQEDGK